MEMQTLKKELQQENCRTTSTIRIKTRANRRTQCLRVRRKKPDPSSKQESFEVGERP
jgi:hypothetical protein